MTRGLTRRAQRTTTQARPRTRGAARRGAARLGMVRAIRREPGQSYRLVPRDFLGVNFVDALAVVPGIGMVDRVHCDRFRVVVDRDVDRPAKSLLDPG